MNAAATDSMALHVFYLHGFASSASSSKAAFFKARLAEKGITLRTPDFNEPDFSTLTITRMVDQVLAEMAALPSGPVVLIGSSLGAFVALQATVRHRRNERSHGAAPPAEGTEPLNNTDRHRESLAHTSPPAPSYAWIDRLVLLAPALDFGARRDFALGDRTHDEWKRTGVTNVFHHSYGRMIPVHYGLYADACGYECENLTLDLPIQIFQGRNDTVVDPQSVEAWVSRRPNVELHLLDDDHQLGSSLEYIWIEVQSFLGV